MKRFTVFVCVFMMVLAFTGGLRAEAAESIGMVIAAEGSVYVQREGGQYPLSLQALVYQSDVITTGSDGKVQILLNDDSALTMGASSVLELREFALDGADSTLNAHLGEGMLRVITGRVTESNPDGFKLSTPLATVGIRGTIFTMLHRNNQGVLHSENTRKILTANGVDLVSNQKMLFGADGSATKLPLDMSDKFGAIDQSMFDYPDDASLPGQTDNPPSMGGAGDLQQSQSMEQMEDSLDDVIIQDGLLNTTNPTNPIMPTYLSAEVSGSLDIGGSFRFYVSLDDGSIDRARISSVGSFTLNDGTGAFNGNSFLINGTQGVYGDTTTTVNSWKMQGSGGYQTVGDPVTGTYEVIGSQPTYRGTLDGGVNAINPLQAMIYGTIDNDNLSYFEMTVNLSNGNIFNAYAYTGDNTVDVSDGTGQFNGDSFVVNGDQGWHYTTPGGGGTATPIDSWTIHGTGGYKNVGDDVTGTLDATVGGTSIPTLNIEGEVAGISS